MLQNAYLLTKIGADTAENEQHFAEILPKIGNYPTGRLTPWAGSIEASRPRGPRRGACFGCASSIRTWAWCGLRCGHRREKQPLLGALILIVERWCEGERTRIKIEGLLLLLLYWICWKEDWEKGDDWKALAEIYTKHSFAPFFNLKISAKKRQHF